MEIVPTDVEIQEVLAWAKNDKSKFPGMSYENGVETAIKWLLGKWPDRPDAP